MIKIALTGPESTGKSTLAAQLASHYGTVWVPEYARTYIGQLGRVYTLQDIEEIAQGQLALERELEQQANGLMFIDTEMLVLKVWSEHAFGQCPSRIQEALQAQRYNLCLLMGVDLPWEPDPQREHPHLRQYFYDWYRRELECLQVPFAEVRGQRQERLQFAISQINALLKNDQQN